MSKDESLRPLVLLSIQLHMWSLRMGGAAGRCTALCTCEMNKELITGQISTIDCCSACIKLRSRVGMALSTLLDRVCLTGSWQCDRKTESVADHITCISDQPGIGHDARTWYYLIGLIHSWRRVHCRGLRSRQDVSLRVRLTYPHTLRAKLSSMSLHLS